MPGWLRTLLEKGGQVVTVNQIGNDGKLKKVSYVTNETPGILPVLARLCESDPTLDYVYLCSPGVRHISKLKNEGGFCGYRNIQMMFSYIIAAAAPGHQVFDGKVPTIFQIQDVIEDAWENGINAIGRVETGGIKGTRRYIGTPEV